MSIDFKQSLADKLTAAIHQTDPTIQDDIESFLETPPDPEMGDLAFPCFRLAKAFRKSPPIIAQGLLETLERANFIQDIKAVGGYLNFYLDRSFAVAQTLSNILSAGDRYGASDLGHGKTITIDYSAPNIAKHFHVGHLSSTMIGHALANLHRKLGYTVIGINYLGDWGTQFGKLITAYQKWGDRAHIEETGIDGLTALYVRFHDEADKDESLNDEARAWLVKMQNGDEEALSLWKWFKDLSMEEYDRLYKRLGVTFECTKGESAYNDKLGDVVQELKEKNLLKESKGAMIVDLGEQIPPCLILRSDGGSLYPTRDIASAKDRKQTYNFHKSLYVTALDQNLHFIQWMKVIELMGYPWAKDMVHIPFGLVVFENEDGGRGKLSTRRGHVIKMEDLLNEAVAKTRILIENKNPQLPQKEAVAEQVGIGAVIFNQMYNNRIKDVMFSWDRMLNFDGETGPYVQYTHARACSLLEKAGQEANEKICWEFLTDKDAYATVRILETFPEKIQEAADKYEPFIISRYLIALAQGFNQFYHKVPILNSAPEERAARLVLVRCVELVLRLGLALLGIAAPEKM